MGLGRARHCVYHELPSDSHMGDIRETLPGRMGAHRLQVERWYPPHLMVPKTRRWVWGVCVCAAFRPPPSRPSTEQVLSWLYYCRRLSNGSRQEGVEGKNK